MATKNFKGFQLITLTKFNTADFTKDNDTLYFVRTRDDKSDGFLYFNGKKYGNAEQAKAELVAKYGDLKIGENNVTIADYVAAEIAKVNSAADTLGKKVSALETTVGDATKGLVKDAADNKAAIAKLNGTEDGSVTKAVSDAKSELIGTETDASTKDTIKGAKKAAAEAKEAADAKVASVGVTGAIVKTGEETTPTIGLKLAETQGNVVLSQENGLKAEIDLTAFGVKGVAEGEKVISVSTNGLLSSTLSLKYDSVAKKINLYGKAEDETNLVSSIDATAFVKDGMLKSAELKVYAEKIDETHPAGTYIVLTWNDDAQSGPMYINVTSLIDTYTAKANGGLVLEDHAFSVDTGKIATTESVNKLNATHAKVGGEGADKENFKTVAAEVSEGIAGIGEVSKASAEGAADVKVTVTTKAGSVTSVAVDASQLAGKVTTNEAAITKEAETARAAEKTNADAIAALDKKITNGAVTLEVNDSDKYLGVSSATTTDKGIVYTLASKADAIDKAIKDAVDGKNVTAVGESGDTALVGASAADNKVTVTTTDKLKDAVALAETSVQSVNGETGATVVLDATKIAVGTALGEQAATAKVNAVLADIYTKLGLVVKADGKTIIEDTKTHTLSVNLETTSDANVQAGHIEIKQNTESGALYSVMYYSGDDVDEAVTQ